MITQMTPLMLLARLFAILPGAILFGIKFDQPHVLIIAVALLIFARFLPERPFLHFVVCAALLFVPDLFVGLEPGRFTLGDSMFRVHYTIPALLYAAASALSFRTTFRTVMTGCTCSVFALLLQPEVAANPAIVNTVMPFSGLLEKYNILYRIMIFLNGIGNLLLLAESTRLSRLVSGGSSTARYRHFLTAGLFLLIPVAALTFREIYRENAHLLRRLEGEILARRARNRAMRRYRQGHESDINRPYRSNPDFEQRMLYYLRPDHPGGWLPERLRVRSFQFYRKGVWRNPPERDPLDLDMMAQTDTALTTHIFLMPDMGVPDAQKDRKFTLYPLMKQLSGLLPLCGETRTIEMIASSAQMAQDGTVSPYNWNQDGGITLTVRRPDDAMQRPAGTPPQICTHVPERLRLQLGAYLEYLKLSGTDREKAMKIVQYLQKNFRYSTEPPEKLPRWAPRDPVLRFLTVTRRGHCEVFASAAVLLARQAGLPARYVTGYLVRPERKLNDDTLFIAGADSHAWTEIYLPDEQRWIAVDATPADAIGIQNISVGWMQKMRFLFVDWQLAVRRGYPLRFLAVIYDAAAELPLWIWLFLPVSGAAIVWLIRKKHRRGPGKRKRTVEMRRLEKIFRRLERQHNIRRKSSMTLREWAELLPPTDGLPEQIRRYEKLLFGRKDG